MPQGKIKDLSRGEILNSVNLISKLINAFNQIQNNLISDLKEKYTELQALWPSLNTESLHQIDAQREKYIEYINNWKLFIENVFYDENNSDILFNDIYSDKLAVKARCRMLSSIFHPDKHGNNKIFSIDLSNTLTPLINEYSSSCSTVGPINFEQYTSISQEHIKNYEENKNNKIAGLRNYAQEELLKAIDCLKEVVLSANKDAWNYRFSSKNCMTEIQIQARMQLAECYEMQSSFFHAQIYIIGALRLVEYIEKSSLRDSWMKKLHEKLSYLKNSNINKNEIKTSDGSNEKKTSSNLSYCDSKELSLVMSYKEHMRGVFRSYLTISPESNLVKYKIRSDLIKKIDAQKSIYKGTAYGLQALGIGGVAAVTAGGIATATAVTTAAAVGGLAAVAILGPVAWMACGLALVGAGIFSVDLHFKGRALSKELNVQNELSKAIDEAVILYKEGRYQQFIDRLSNKRYFSFANPLISYDPKRDIPIKIIKSDEDRPIDLIDTMLSHGFRPDGVAFLLNIIAEVILTSRFEHQSVPAMILHNALQMLDEIRFNERLVKDAELIDHRIDKDFKKKNEVESFNVIKKFIHNARKNYKQSTYIIHKKYNKVISEEYIKDFKEMPILIRLNEMRNIAKINNAIALLMTDTTYVENIKAFNLLNEVKNYYKNSPYAILIGERMDLITELTFAFGIPIENINECNNNDLNLIERAWNLHDEFNKIAFTDSPKLTTQIDDILLKLSSDNHIDKPIYALLILDQLYNVHIQENWIRGRVLLKLLHSSFSTDKYSIHNQFLNGWLNLVRVYTSAFTKSHETKHAAYDFFSQSFDKLDLKDIKKACKKLNSMLENKLENGIPAIFYAKNKLINDLQAGLLSLFLNQADEFTATLIISIFNKLQSSDQMKLIYTNNFDLTSENLLNSWKKLFLESYELHAKNLNDQIAEFLLSETEDIELYQVIECKLRKIDHSAEGVHRKKIFKELMDNLSELNKSVESYDYSSSLFNFIKNINLDNKICTPKEYYAQILERMRSYFSDDLTLYRDERAKASRAGLFSANTEVTNLKNELTKRVIGQSYAIETVSATMISMRKNKKPEKSITFLFSGPTGVGKTELAKAISANIANDRSSSDRSPLSERLVSFSMEKYSSEFSVSSLYGSPTGYSGSTDKPPFAQEVDQYATNNGDGTKTIKNTVLLFDEFEKAHSDVKQSLLGLFDGNPIEIYYTNDKKVEKISYIFQDCIFICTSNLFSKEITEDFSSGKTLDQIKAGFKLNLVEKSHLKEIITPEMAGRMEFVPFGPISQGKDFQKLIDIYLLAMLRNIAEKFELHARVDSADKADILSALENEHYNNGISIRTFKFNLKNLFNKFFSEINIDAIPNDNRELIIKFDYISNRVILNLAYENFGDQVIIDSKDDGEKFYFSKPDENRNTISLV